MVTMGRLPRGLAAVLATVALGAMMPAPCACPERAAPPPGEHACCPPPVGLSSSAPSCCDDHATAIDVLVPGPAAAMAPVAVAVVRLEPVPRQDAGRPHRSAFLTPSPPPAVLRI
ncbi:MAG TPA: hypothetical protein VMT70_10900 [Vicinamibacteria bacterium]|nr:hypothetical protein [Vicinamibacteria bacterium]